MLALQRLKESAEKAKIELSSSQQTEINLPYITPTHRGPKHLNMKITRAKFEALVEELVERTIEPCRIAIKDAGVKVSDIDDVILVGGMTRMPKVQEKVKEFFGKEPRKDVNPDEAVAVGAAIQGVGAFGRPQGRAAARRDAAVARHRDARRRDDEDDPEEHHHPDQVQPDLLDRRRQPAGRDDQGVPGRARDRVRQQGARRVQPRGYSAGSRAARRRSRSAFDIDANGILHVSAKDKATGKENKITIKANSGLTEAEIDKMVKDAEAQCR